MDAETVELIAITVFIVLVLIQLPFFIYGSAATYVHIREASLKDVSKKYGGAGIFKTSLSGDVDYRKQYANKQLICSTMTENKYQHSSYR